MTHCSICDDEIDDEDERYELPDGDIVCTARPCIVDWEKKYKKPGKYIEYFMWVEEGPG